MEQEEQQKMPENFHVLYETLQIITLGQKDMTNHDYELRSMARAELPKIGSNIVT